MGHGNAFVDHEAIHLVEGVGVGAVDGFVAESAADGEDSEGGLGVFEDAALEGGALGAEDEAVFDVEGVLLVHGGVVGWIVEGVEVVFEVFDFG